MDIPNRVSTVLGELLKPLRAGEERLAQAKQTAVSRRIRMDSPSFQDGQPMPDYLAGPHGRSPALRWSRPPDGTIELVLLCEDPDAPTPEPFVHWLVYDIAPSVRELNEGLPPSEHPLRGGVLQGRNTTLRYGYTGPEPPPGHGVHHYHFQLFALDARPDLEAPVGRRQLIEKMRGHVLGAGELVGTYERR